MVRNLWEMATIMDVKFLNKDTQFTLTWLAVDNQWLTEQSGVT